MRPFEIDPDITRAETPPGELYTSPDWYALQRERVLARGWHAVIDPPALPDAGEHHPFLLLPGCLDEPLVLVRGGDGELRCLSNVCPHRGNLVALEAGRREVLRCGYHGRRFLLDGEFLSMPEFEDAVGFPRPGGCDGLTRLPLERWGPVLFTGLDPSASFEDWIAPVRERLVTLPVDELVAEPEDQVDYEFDGHWALYCDNYLEGFHIPYVHPALARVLDYKSYRIEAHDWGVVQVGIAAAGEDALPLGAENPYSRERVGGLYFWLFPGTMLNFYPWGLSLNAVQPLGHGRTRVVYRTWIWDRSRRGEGAGADVHQTESEDQAVVGTTYAGVGSRLYRRGRYSPTQEVGVHRFHRLLVEHLHPMPTEA